tara:strand:- start:10584 stop:12395 length:1812 start_codon:yes stop_codon:yes gene_type:complete
MKTSKFKPNTYIISDSEEAIKLAKKNGLVEKQKIITSSPYLVLNKNYFYLESFWTLNKIKKFYASIERNRKEIFKKLSIQKNVSIEEALIVSMQITDYYKIIYKAACLNNKILDNNILYLRSIGYSGRKNIDLNTPWQEILKSKRNFTYLDYKIGKKIAKKSTIHEYISSLFYKIQLMGLDGLLFRLIKRFKILNIFRRKIVFVLGENELLEESSFSMIFKGYGIHIIEKKNNSPYHNSKNINLIKKIIKNDIYKITSYWVNNDIVNSCENIFFKNLSSGLREFYESKNSTEDFLLKYKNTKNILFNARYLNSYVLGILITFKKFKIPIISFQHGVTPEISDFKTDHGLYTPGNCSDFFIYFNDAITKIAQSQDFIKSKGHVVGLPNKYFRVSKMKDFFTPSKNKILYLSMNLYKGHFGANNGYINDIEKAKQECYFVQKVLGKIPHHIDYKPYIVENLRYFDEDPVLEIIKNTKNVDLLDHNIDARYILSKYKLVITTSASSTLSWCIMSNVPLIFINDIKQSPLKKSLHNKVKNSVFFFDRSNKYFRSELKDLLSNSLEDISFMYKKKRKNREDLIKNYFSKYKKNAGKRSANFIIKKYFH